MWKYDILSWFGMEVAGALLEKNCEWTLDMLSLRHSTYPRPLPLLVIHYKQRKKVKYKSQILKTSIFQFFKDKWRWVFNVLQTFQVCPSLVLQCRFCEIWLIWHFHQSSHADVITDFMWRRRRNFWRYFVNFLIGFSETDFARFVLCYSKGLFLVWAKIFFGAE